jgi:hypothetical protein
VDLTSNRIGAEAVDTSADPAPGLGGGNPGAGPVFEADSGISETEQREIGEGIE